MQIPMGGSNMALVNDLARYNRRAIMRYADHAILLGLRRDVRRRRLGAAGGNPIALAPAARPALLVL